ncbi:MAG: TonB family protein [Elusimicrobia bacterium]|nr:TonB family protein [Elusimicrobiota bacterium]
MTFMEDGRREQYSAGLAFAFHILAFGFYLLLLHKPVEEQLVLTQVDFIDMKAGEQESAAAAAAMQAPAGIKDFLKMALPTFKSPGAETQPRDIEIKTDSLQRPEQPAVDRLIDRGQLNREPSIKLDSPALGRPSSARFAEASAPKGEPAFAEAKIQDSPAIALEAVGRRAVRAGEPGGIRIDPKAALSRGGRFQDLSARAGPAAPGGSGNAATAAIDLKEGPALARRGGGGGSLPVGYGAGAGTRLSLSERPVARGASGAGLAPVPGKAAQAKTEAVEASRSNKGMEISGPLAGRQLLSFNLPPYPEWARERGIEAEVIIRFFVSPEGQVLDRMIIERTSGYRKLDDLAKQSLSRMVFAPLPKGQKEDQWGLVTFRYRLK